MSESNKGGEAEMLTLAAVMGTVCFFDPDKRWMIGPWPPQSEGLAIWAFLSNIQAWSEPALLMLKIHRGVRHYLKYQKTDLFFHLLLLCCCFK